jgi:hypothetical protein
MHGTKPGLWMPGRILGHSGRCEGKERMDALTVDTLAEVLQEPNRPLLTQGVQALSGNWLRVLLIGLTS